MASFLHAVAHGLPRHPHSVQNITCSILPDCLHFRLRTINNVTQRCDRRRCLTIGSSSTRTTFVIFSFCHFFHYFIFHLIHFFRCYALSSRSLGFGISISKPLFQPSGWSYRYDPFAAVIPILGGHGCVAHAGSGVLRTRQCLVP